MPGSRAAAWPPVNITHSLRLRAIRWAPHSPIGRVDLRYGNAIVVRIGQAQTHPARGKEEQWKGIVSSVGLEALI